MQCSKCRSDNPAINRFCGDCGAPLAVHCPRCRAENPPGHRFCGYCGTALSPANGTAQSPTSAGHTPDLTLPPEQLAAAEGERKTVTALFADIKGSTELMESLDPEMARETIDPALGIMVEAVRRYEGYVVQSTGDGVFALFGAPLAREDHPQRAVLAGLAMQQALRPYAEKLKAEGRAPVEARVGVSTGEVVMREIRTGDYPEYAPIGHTANLAARLQEIAPLGSIAVSDRTRVLIEGYFELRPLGAFQVKGFGAAVDVYEVTGQGPLQGHFQIAVRRGLAKFVGRQHEIEEIGRAFEMARIGRGEVVAVIGEPGVGKSRLLHEFKQVRPAECLMLEASAISHSAAIPYYIVIELLRGYFGLLPGDTQQQRWEKVESKVLEYGLQDTLPYLCPLLALPWDAGTQESDPKLKRRRTIDAVKQLLVTESRSRPLLLVIEDLHWLDRESQAFLWALSSSIATAHMLELVSFRPEFRHEFGNRSYYKQIHLNPLSADEARWVLQSHLGPGPVLPELAEFIVLKSEGNPLFIEELLQALIDQGLLIRGDSARLTRPLNGVAIPATVQGILASRIDRLPTEEKGLLQAMAVIGRSAHLNLLKRVVSWPDAHLQHMLGNLQFLEFVYEQPTALGTEYVLKHALTQDVAYNSLLRDQRATLHEGVARAVETLYVDRLHDHLDELAHHYSRSRNTGKAVQYHHLAGRQALGRSALVDGVFHLTDALKLLEAQEAGRERAQQELQVRLLLGPALMASEGYASPKVEEVYSRARQLCEVVGDSSQLCAVLYGLFGFHNTRAAYSTSYELALEMVRLADHLKNPVFLALASFSAGQTEFLLGKPGRCRRQFERTAGSYSRERHGELTLLAGFDCGIAAMAWDSLAMWMMGYPNEALGNVESAAALAQQLSHPHSLVYVLSFRAWLYLFRREWRAALEGAQTMGALAEEHGLPLWSLWATALGGAAMAEMGEAHQGREQLTACLEAMRAAGAGITMTQTLGLIAQAYARSAEPQKGLMALEEALTVAETSGERYYLAELNRLRGELLLISDPSNHAAAERCFRTSIEIARTQEARTLELRATTSLARLLQDGGRRDEARAMQAGICGWFTDGFDTIDLKEANALLHELNS